MPGPNDHSVSDMIEANKQLRREQAKPVSTNGKGDKRRPGSYPKFAQEYERIFGKKAG